MSCTACIPGGNAAVLPAFPMTQLRARESPCLLLTFLMNNWAHRPLCSAFEPTAPFQELLQAMPAFKSKLSMLSGPPYAFG